MLRSFARRVLPVSCLALVVWILSLPTVGPRALASSGFRDGFDVDGALEESGSMGESTSAGWWLNSGGYLLREAGVGKTIQGTLPANDRWRLAYASSNPLDTEDGYRPQNVFRLVSRDSWRDFDQQVAFRIRRINLTDSPSRDAWSGIFFFVRYLDGDDTYYAGLRVDGAAVVKKKLGGTYSTLGYRRLYAGAFDRWAEPNLLPEGTWIGMRCVTTTTAGGSTHLRLYVDDPSLGEGWTPVLEVEDGGSGPSGPSIAEAGFAGIRTDFMDVELEEYSALPIASGTPAPTVTATPTPMGEQTTPTPKPSSKPKATRTPTPIGQLPKVPIPRL